MTIRYCLECVKGAVCAAHSLREAEAIRDAWTADRLQEIRSFIKGYERGSQNAWPLARSAAQ